MSYHEAVLKNEAVEGLNVSQSGVYVDVTFGAGGHSRAILEKLGPKGHLYAFDQDPDAAKNAIIDKRFTLVPENFRHLARFLRLYKVSSVDGILADLGVSSHQFDEASRGFSWRFDAPLDMRMNPTKGMSAAQVINEYPENELARVLGAWGEVKSPGRVARELIAARPIDTTKQLVAVLETISSGKRAPQFFAQVFQALRIEVNQELEVLENLLLQALDLLKPGGRLVVISYHSLEDRMVKRFLREGKLAGEADRDFFGNRLVPFALISRKAIKPSESEIAENPRARSARMRIAEKL